MLDWFFFVSLLCCWISFISLIYFSFVSLSLLHGMLHGWFLKYPIQLRISFYFIPVLYVSACGWYFSVFLCCNMHFRERISLLQWCHLCMVNLGFLFLCFIIIIILIIAPRNAIIYLTKQKCAVYPTRSHYFLWLPTSYSRHNHQIVLYRSYRSGGNEVSIQN